MSSGRQHDKNNIRSATLIHLSPDWVYFSRTPEARQMTKRASTVAIYVQDVRYDGFHGGNIYIAAINRSYSDRC
jgi:hypothetical protein